MHTTFLMAEMDDNLYDAEAVVRQLGWPTEHSAERMTASVFVRAAEIGFGEAAQLILTQVFERTVFPPWAKREDRMAVCRYALCRLFARHGRLDDLRFGGPEHIVPDEVVVSDEWCAFCPQLPSVRGGKEVETMNDKTNETRKTEMPEKEVTLLHWERVQPIMPRFADPSREATCLEWVIGVTLAHAIAVANAPFCAGEKDELADLNLRRVIEIIAERIEAGMLDDTIFILREVLRHCVGKGEPSFFAEEADQEL